MSLRYRGRPISAARPKLRPGLPPRLIQRQNVAPVLVPAQAVAPAASLGLERAAGPEHAKIVVLRPSETSGSRVVPHQFSPALAAAGSRLHTASLPADPPPVANPRHEPESASAPSTAAAPDGNALILRGDYWQATYEGRSGILNDSRGLRYIALLIQHAGHGNGPLHATELVALATGRRNTLVELSSKEEILDSGAETRFVKRLEEIGFERNTALAADDYDKVASLDEEVDRITDELQRVRVPGSGGRRATFNHAGEKARKAVGKAISETISKLFALPDTEPLARHLSSTLHKGQWLSYNGNVEWHVSFPAANPIKRSSFLPRQK